MTKTRILTKEAKQTKTKQRKKTLKVFCFSRAIDWRRRWWEIDWRWRWWVIDWRWFLEDKQMMLWCSLTERGGVVFTDGYVHGKTRVGEAWQFILEKNIPFKHLFSNIISKGQGGPLQMGRCEVRWAWPIWSISSRPHRPLCHWARVNQQHPPPMLVPSTLLTNLGAGSPPPTAHPPPTKASLGYLASSIPVPYPT